MDEKEAFGTLNISGRIMLLYLKKKAIEYIITTYSYSYDNF